MPDEERPSQGGSISTPVKVAVVVAVLAAGVLPFAFTGTVANWAAVAFLALVVVVLVVAVVMELAGVGQPKDPSAEETDLPRRLAGAAVAAALLAFNVWGAFEDSGNHRTHVTPGHITGRQLQKTEQALKHCETPNACVRKLLHETKGGK
jgi:hypothetical protein